MQVWIGLENKSNYTNNKCNLINNIDKLCVTFQEVRIEYYDTGKKIQNSRLLSFA